VGGASEVEVKEKKDRVEDAMHATRAAVEEGILPGGGTALLYATNVLKNLKVENDDQRYGVDIVRKALSAPLKQIAQNAGHDGAVIAGKILESKDNTYGFDAQSGKFCDLVKAGIVDPTKVVRTALIDAVSVAALLTTTEAMITDKPEDKSAPAMPDMGGMGGMGGGMPGMPPPMPPIPPISGIAGADLSSGLSVIIASVVVSRAATETASINAVLTTLVGSTIPAFTKSQNFPD
jgi:chaperonin GroEL